MVLGWSGAVVNFYNQDLTLDRNRDGGVTAVVVGAVATVLFLVAVGTAWYSARRAVLADRRGPAETSAVRRTRDRHRRRGVTATRWAAAAVVVNLLLALPVGHAIKDLRVPDELWPRDPLVRFGIAADNAAADAAELETVLSGTADQVGLDFRTGREPSRARCRLPDGSVGTYYKLNPWRHDGFTYDPVAVTDSVAEYWESLGYSVDEMSYARTAIFSREMHSPAGGKVYITISPGSTELGGYSGCSAARD
jgi:hypothetical protein